MREAGRELVGVAMHEVSSAAVVSGKAAGKAAGKGDGKAAGKAREARSVAATPRIHPRQILWLTGVISVFALSATGSYILWETTMWDDYINDQLVIRNNTEGFESWTKSKVTGIIKYWIFNYTNVEEFREGKAEKLHVQEVGPYAFREQIYRVNVVFNNNGTVSFQERKDYRFIPELSNGTFFDNITSINVVYLSVSHIAPKMSYLEQAGMWSAVKLFKPEPLVTHTAREWFWGYTDTLTAIATLKEGSIKTGIIESANGTMPDRLTVHTGELGLDKLGQITRYNGREAMDYYSHDECNRVDGSDGSRFPPPRLTPGEVVHIYHPEACRRVPLVHKADVTVWDDVPAMRYSVPNNLFANGSELEENSCYCKESYYEKCYPSGVINTHHCRKGAPLFASFPHFLHGDKVLLEAVDGLNPDPERHQMHIDIHKRVGATVSLASRFQMSVLASNFFGDPILKKVDGKILPYTWMERTLEDFPEDLRATFRLLSFVAPSAHTALRWACPLLAALTGLVLLVCAYVEVAALLRPDAPLAARDELTRL